MIAARKYLCNFYISFFHLNSINLNVFDSLDIVYKSISTGLHQQIRVVPTLRAFYTSDHKRRNTHLFTVPRIIRIQTIRYILSQ